MNSDCGEEHGPHTEMRYAFADYLFDPERGLEGPGGRIALRRSDERLLRLLLEADGRTVSKDSIVATVWGGRAVTDDSIFQAVRRLRQAMPASSGAYVVQTVHGAGLRIGTRVQVRSSGAMAPPPESGRSTSTEAVAALTSARELSARRTQQGLAAAIEATGRALQLEPDYVDAWCALAEFHVLQLGRGIVTGRVGGAAAIEAADRALALDPRCAPALAVRGWIRAVVDLDVTSGLEDLDASTSLEPRHWFARGLRGWAQFAAGRPQEAVSEIQAAMGLNPWANWLSGFLALYQLFAGDADAALAEACEATRRFPDVEVSFQQFCAVASSLGRHAEALAAGRRAVELTPDLPLVRATYASALARAGHAARAREQIDLIEHSGLPLPGVWLAGAALALGERRRAIEMLEEAREAGAPQFVYLAFDPRLAELRGDAAFERLCPKAG